MWRMYVLSCADGSFYCGITTNLERRIKEHNGGTKKKGLFLLRYLGSSVEECKHGFYVAREIMHQNEALMLGCDGERPRIWDY